MADIPSQTVWVGRHRVQDDMTMAESCKFGDMNADPILDVVNIEKISTLIFLHRINQRDFDIANLDEAVRQITSNEISSSVTSTNPQR